MKEIIKSVIISIILTLLLGFGMVIHAQAEHISTLQKCIVSRDSLINNIINRY